MISHPTALTLEEQRFLERLGPHLKCGPDCDAGSLRAIIRRLDALVGEESAIVDRVWAALGRTTYEQAAPYAIDEHVVRLHNDRDALARALKDAEERVLRHAPVCLCDICEWLEATRVALALARRSGEPS